jgi:hypothetical protein
LFLRGRGSAARTTAPVPQAFEAGRAAGADPYGRYVLRHAVATLWATLAEAGFRVFGIERSPARMLATGVTAAAAALVADRAVPATAVEVSAQAREDRAAVTLIAAGLLAGLTLGALLVARDDGGGE